MAASGTAQTCLVSAMHNIDTTTFNCMYGRYMQTAAKPWHKQAIHTMLLMYTYIAT